MTDVFKVADFFIQAANESPDDFISNMKLNKLLYYAQGVSLARHGRPLFEDDVEAWDYGPVVPPVYHKYKVCGRNPITEYERMGSHDFQKEDFNTLVDVLCAFGGYTGSGLVTLTHKPGTPWRQAIEAGEKILSQASMSQFFRDNPVQPWEERLAGPTLTSAPADWYDPSEDAEWEAYL